MKNDDQILFNGKGKQARLDPSVGVRAPICKEVVYNEIEEDSEERMAGMDDWLFGLAAGVVKKESVESGGRSSNAMSPKREKRRIMRRGFRATTIQKGIHSYAMKTS